MPDTQGTYDDIRPILNPALRNLSDAELAEYLAANGVDAEGWNDFMSAVSTAMPTIQRVASGVMSGAQTGSTFGPYGALIGGIGGGVIGGLSQPQAPSAPPAAGPPAAPPQPHPLPAPPAAAPPQQWPPPGLAPSPYLAAPAAPPALGGSPSAAQLLALLSQPQVMQALAAMGLGTAGASSISAGGTQMPVSAVPRALATLANNAASEYDRDAFDEGWIGLGVDPNDRPAVTEAVFGLFGRQDDPEPAPVTPPAAAPPPPPPLLPPPPPWAPADAWTPVATYDEVYS